MSVPHFGQLGLAEGVESGCVMTAAMVSVVAALGDGGS